MIFWIPDSSLFDLKLECLLVDVASEVSIKKAIKRLFPLGVSFLRSRE